MRKLLLTLGLALVAAGCGGSSGSSGMTSAPTATSSATTATSSATASTTATSASSSAAVPDSTPRVPATFVIGPGDRVRPAQISVPARLRVQLTIVSRDGRVHHVVLKTTPLTKLTVPAGSQAFILIPGPKAGRYQLLVDGRVRGALVTGAQPGP